MASFDSRFSSQFIFPGDPARAPPGVILLLGNQWCWRALNVDKTLGCPLGDTDKKLNLLNLLPKLTCKSFVCRKDHFNMSCSVFRYEVIHIDILIVNITYWVYRYILYIYIHAIYLIYHIYIYIRKPAHVNQHMSINQTCYINIYLSILKLCVFIIFFVVFICFPMFFSTKSSHLISSLKRSRVTFQAWGSNFDGFQLQ